MCFVHLEVNLSLTFEFVTDTVIEIASDDLLSLLPNITLITNLAPLNAI